MDVARWTIPAPRIKAGREFAVPFGAGALDELKRARAPSAESPFVFPSRNREAVAEEGATGRVLRRAELAGGPP